MSHIAISAAEVSGDLLASALIKSLKTQTPNLQITGLAGDKMHAAGCRRLWNMQRVNVMGLSEVLRKLPALLKLRREMIQHFKTHPPALFIGVDAPDFNFHIERCLKQHGIKTVHFVSPSVWAWRASRMRKIKQSTDLMLCVFPFEVALYQKHHQRAVFVGHPLAQSLSPRPNHTSTHRIVLMPGSRRAEVKHLLPEMLSAVKILHAQNPKLSFHLVLANATLAASVASQCQNTPVNLSIGDAHAQIARADLVLVASGTATLEVALIGVPMVVVYKLSKLTHFVVSRMLTTPYVALPNVIAGRALVPELIQNNATGSNIARTARILLSQHNSLRRAELIASFQQLHQQLQPPSEHTAARAILDLIDA